MALTSMKFHLSLNVSNLARSVAFYRVLFGMEAAKCHDDYAKFELVEPPVVFSLVPQVSLTSGSLSRIGLRLADEAAVAEMKQRLEAAGLAVQTPAGCCNGTLKKCYVADPDLNYWEISAGAADELPASVPAHPPKPAVSLEMADGPVVWEHYISGSLPERIPHADGSVDEVRLTGTFNAALEDGRRELLLREAQRVLRPGGKVVVHGLVGDRPFHSQPQLPGLAALVQRVPAQTEPLQALRGAGFVGIQFTKFSEKSWFQIDGIEMREVKLIAFKAETPTGQTRPVIYRGPFAQAVDDVGNTFPRGQRVTVAAAAAERLQKSAAAEQFLFPKPVSAAAACCVS
jgi:catechol 2,3-dioxygenase-like lactoylglutathione lyase family enzyme